MSASNSDPLQRAQLALSQGDLREARALCEGVLARNAGSADARYLLGLAHALAAEPEAAIVQWRQVLERRPRHFATLANLGVALSRQGEHAAAAERLRAALTIDASQPSVHFNLGNSLLALGDVEGAIGSLTAALARDPHFAAARNSLGAAYRRAGRPQEARVEFEAAIAADPACVEAHCNLGALLVAEGSSAAAAASYRRALQVDRHCLEAALELARALEQLGQLEAALGVLADATSAHPRAGEAHYARGVTLHRAGRLEGALACYEQAITLHPDDAGPWRDRARALEALQRLPESLESYRQAVSLAPADAVNLAGLLSACVRMCEWALGAQLLQQLRAIPPDIEALHPFLSLSVCEDPAEQLRCARAHARGFSESRLPGAPWVRASGERLRVAYVSADFGEHPVSHLLAGVLERHDRKRFELIGVSLRTGTSSAFAQRMRAAFDRFIETGGRSDEAVADFDRASGFGIDRSSA